MSNIPKEAVEHSALLHKRAEALAKSGLGGCAVELRRIERNMTSDTYVEWPLRVLCIAVALIAERG